MKRLLVKAKVAAADRTRCSSYDYTVRSVTPAAAWYFPERLEPERVREALAHVLSDYGEFAGRLKRRKNEWWIEHGHGVALELAERSETNAELHAAAEVTPKLIYPSLSILGVLRGKRPLFAARLTLTRDGCVLAVIWHHMLGDLHGAMLLLRAWALAYTGRAHEPPLPVPDRDAYMTAWLPSARQDPELIRSLSIGEMFQILWRVQVGCRMVELSYSSDELATIHAAAASSSSSVTEHDALCAHVFLMLRELAEIREPTRLTLAVNLRKRLGLPANVGGNLIDFAAASADQSADTATLAAGLRRSITALSNGPLTYHALTRLAADGGSPDRLVPASYDPIHHTLFLTSWCKFGMYELCFGSSRPQIVQCTPHDKGIWVGIVAEKPRDGLYVRLWLPSRLAQRVAEHHAQRLDVPRLTLDADALHASSPSTPA